MRSYSPLRLHQRELYQMGQSIWCFEFSQSGNSYATVLNTLGLAINTAH